MYQGLKCLFVALGRLALSLRKAQKTYGDLERSKKANECPANIEHE